jgi:ABC-type glycerol-3-phosphate transport system substrate-binding protein
MRTNGFDFHMALAAGEVSWTDERVRETFANWRKLIDMGAYVDNHQTYSWQEALPFMVNGDAAAYLMGNFAVAPLRDAGLTDDQLDFYQFPVINPDVELAEDAPTDTFHIPANAANKEAARAFLRYVVSPEVQTWINNGENLGQLPVNAQSSVDDDKFLQQGFEMLSSKRPPAASPSSSTATRRRRWPRRRWRASRSSWCPTISTDILRRLERARSAPTTEPRSKRVCAVPHPKEAQRPARGQPGRALRGPGRAHGAD